MQYKIVFLLDQRSTSTVTTAGTAPPGNTGSRVMLLYILSNARSRDNVKRGRRERPNPERYRIVRPGFSVFDPRGMLSPPRVVMAGASGEDSLQQEQWNFPFLTKG